MIKKIYINSKTAIMSASYCALLISAFATQAANASTLTGVIKDDQGNVMQGVLVRVTDEISGVSEAVYTNPKGKYQLETELAGKLTLRARVPYFKDIQTSVQLGINSNQHKNLAMEAMTDKAEISASLPAAYHFGSLPFETGDNSNFNQYQFTRDCLSCHQVGNSFTRVPRSPELWALTIERMHGYVGNFDAVLKERRSVLLSKGFDGKPISVRPQFPLAKELTNTKIYEYALEASAYIPHDTIAHPRNGLLYTVDQGTDNMIITDTKTGQSEYIPHPKVTDIDPNDPYGGLHGIHSMDLASDGKYYITNAFSDSIGVFNPKTKQWEAPHKIPVETGGQYPHTIRIDSQDVAWFTLTDSEQIGRFDTKTAKFTIIDMPKRKSGGVSSTTEPYGIDINPIDDSVWYGRLFGDIAEMEFATSVAELLPRCLQMGLIDGFTLIEDSV